MSSTFTPGKTYTTGFTTGSDARLSVKIISRTAKTVKVDDDGEIKTLRISTDSDGNESIKPFNYSTAVKVRATNQA